MDQDNCTHIAKLPLVRFKSLLNAASSLPLLCEDCQQISKSHKKDEAEVVYICLDCLHVGCVGESKGHARTHAKVHRDHNFAIKPNGELFCYICAADVIPATNSDKKKMAELQEALREFFNRTNPEESKEVPQRMMVEETKGNKCPETNTSNDVEKINEKLYQQLVDRAKKYPSMNGLNNLGNTCKPVSNSRLF